MQKAVDFLKNTKPKDEIVVVFNNDADGICSCVLMNKYLKHMGINPYIISQPMPPDKNLIRRIQSGIPNKIIFLDLAMDQQPSVLKKVKGFADILIIDHHLIENNMNSPQIVHYNPRFKNPKIYQSTSYLAYKILSKLLDMEDSLWIAAIGIIGDYDIASSMDLIKEVEKKYDLNLFYKIAAMISSVRATKAMTCEQIVELLINTKDPKQLIAGEFLESYQKIELETEAVLIDAGKNAEKIDSVFFYNIKSKYNIRSDISTKLSEKFPDKIIIVYEKIGNNINASVRNQNRRINVDRVLKKAIIGLKASAGGHEVAGGVTMDAKDWDRFKEKLLEILR